MVEYLVSKGADVDTRDQDGTSALHNAVSSKNQKMIEYLVSKGADVNTKDKW
jgi:ankyrin repeat protein